MREWLTKGRANISSNVVILGKTGWKFHLASSFPSFPWYLFPLFLQPSHPSVDSEVSNNYMANIFTIFQQVDDGFDLGLALLLLDM